MHPLSVSTLTKHAIQLKQQDYNFFLNYLGRHTRTLNYHSSVSDITTYHINEEKKITKLLTNNKSINNCVIITWAKVSGTI